MGQSWKPGNFQRAEQWASEEESENCRNGKVNNANISSSAINYNVTLTRFPTWEGPIYEFFNEIMRNMGGAIGTHRARESWEDWGLRLESSAIGIPALTPTARFICKCLHRGCATELTLQDWSANNVTLMPRKILCHSSARVTAYFSSSLTCSIHTQICWEEVRGHSSPKLRWFRTFQHPSFYMPLHLGSSMTLTTDCE